MTPLPQMTKLEKEQATALLKEMCRESFKGWFQSCAKIQVKDPGAPLQIPRMNVMQRKIAEAIDWCDANGFPARIINLKPRQGGSSSVFVGTAYHRARSTPCNVAILGDDKNTTEKLMRMWKRFGENDVMDVMQGWGNNPKNPHQPSWQEFTHGSTLTLETANDPRAGQGGTFQVLCACVPGDTPVIVENGWVKPISEVTPGEKVLTHNGNAATVVAVQGKPNSKGELYKLKVRGASRELCFTHDHKIYTQRGWIMAEDIRIGDRVSMPIRKITGERTSTRLSMASRSDAKCQGSEIALDREFGYFCGYYLSEGHVKLDSHSRTRPIAIIFARHRSESEYADRAFRAVEDLVKTQGIRDRKGCLTSENSFYSTTLASWVNDNFGRTVKKHIPDWVFECSVEFLEGLLAGYFCGDGSKGKCDAYDRVAATTVQCSIATQIRDIVASLRIGWTSISYRPGGNVFGRNCRPNYTLRYGGTAGTAIRALMGLHSRRPEEARKSGANAALWGEHVWLPVRGISRVQCDTVYDLSVDHEDHSFRTIEYAISNSEVASYRSAGHSTGEDVFSSIAGCVPRLPKTLIALESTAQGMTGIFYTTYQGAVTFEEFKSGKRGNGYIKFFTPWFEFDDYTFDGVGGRQSITPYERQEILESLDEDEQRLVAMFSSSVITPERLAWRRQTLAGPDCGGDVDKLNREYPATDVDAFRSTNSGFFDIDGLMWQEQQITPSSMDPKIGEISIDSRGKGALFLRQSAGQFRIWEHPEEGQSYVLSADFKVGRQSAGSSRELDTHAVLVFRAGKIDPRTGAVTLPRVVASTRDDDRSDTDIILHRILALHRYYGDCMVVPEINNSGNIVWQMQQMGITNIWTQPTGANGSHGNGKTAQVLGFNTNTNTRRQILDNMAAMVREQSWICSCPTLLKQMKAFVRNQDGKPEAAAGFHDDFVMSAAIGLFAMPRATLYTGTKGQSSAGTDHYRLERSAISPMGA